MLRSLDHQDVAGTTRGFVVEAESCHCPSESPRGQQLARSFPKRVCATRDIAQFFLKRRLQLFMPIPLPSVFLLCFCTDLSRRFVHMCCCSPRPASARGTGRLLRSWLEELPCDVNGGLALC